MKVRLTDDLVYKHILSKEWASVNADIAALAWVVNQALASAGAPAMFQIDDACDPDDEALVILVPVSNGLGEDAALRILYPKNVDLKLVDDFHQGDVQAVHRQKDGRLLGYLVSYYRSGRVAANKFDPAPGVRVYYDD